MNNTKCLSLLFHHLSGQIRLKVIMSEFNSVNNIGLEKLHKKSVDDKVQRSQRRRSDMFSEHTSRDH